MSARRIPKFHDKLRAALESAGLPASVGIYIDGPTMYPDPTVILEYEYRPGRYAKAFFRTDAHDRDHLEPATVLAGCHADAVKGATDHRYTDEARAASAELAGVLGRWAA